MNAVPIGKMTNENALNAPVVTAARGSTPSGATISASQNPITD
jgi:hypothetical protein